MKIAVVGLGKIGLPLSVQYANKGHQVIGLDTNQNTVNTINGGNEPFPHLSC
jgi:UDP-N-acetyl-D-glucosamine dehydrogenase